MDWQSPKRAFHSNPARERINLMEVASHFLGAVEFGADIRGAVSRRRSFFGVTDHPGTTALLDASAFLDTKFDGRPITSGLLVIRQVGWIIPIAFQKLTFAV
jgi:hypothetical protein